MTDTTALLKEALEAISTMPIPEQDNFMSANMRQIAITALAAYATRPAVEEGQRERVARIISDETGGFGERDDLKLADAILAALSPPMVKHRELVANLIAAGLAAQDGEDFAPLKEGLSWPYIDQGEVDFGLIADSILAATLVYAPPEDHIPDVGKMVEGDVREAVEALESALHELGQLFYRVDLTNEERQTRAQVLIKTHVPLDVAP